MKKIFKKRTTRYVSGVQFSLEELIKECGIVTICDSEVFEEADTVTFKHKGKELNAAEILITVDFDPDDWVEEDYYA